MANWKEQFRLFNGTTPLTGQASNLSFRVSPYSSDIGGLTFTESPSSSGNYLCSGFSAYYKDAKLFLSGVEQTAFGIKNIGDPEDNFVSLSETSTQTLLGQLIASSSGIKTDLIVEKTSNNGVYVDSCRIKDGQVQGSAPLLANTISEYTGGSGVTIDSVLIKDDIYTGHTGRALLAEANVLIVDNNRSSDITGYVYTAIQEAIDYAQTQSPSSTNRWKILIVPHKNNTGYAGSLTIYDYIDIIGLGTVKINGAFSRSGSMSDKNVTLENLHFESTDVSFVNRKVIARNCVFFAIEDSSVADISNEGSQFTNCGFFISGAGTLTSTSHSGIYNRYINCYGNVNISFNASDTQMGYVYDTGSTIQY